MADDRAACDVAIVGGGPAGQAAAMILAAAGAGVIVLDEQPRPGGQIARQSPRAFTGTNWLPGRAYRPLKAQLRAFEARPDITWRGGHSVLGMEWRDDGAEIVATAGHGLVRIAARAVLVAAGCQELAVPIPGWTLPGVMAAGGLQAMLKSQGIIPGTRVLLAGTHPLQLLIARQVMAAGVEVAGVLFAQSRGAMAAAALRHARALVTGGPNLLSAAAAYRALRAGGVAVSFDTRPIAFEGEARVDHARVVDDAGERRIACDAVGLCFGFVPQADLVRAADAAVRPAGRAGGWAAAHDIWMRSSRPDLFVAGETAGIGGAAAASAEGAIAGLGIARHLGLIEEDEAVRRARPWHTRRTHARAFAALLDAVADPAPFPARVQPDATIACRCEDVTLGTLRAAIRAGRSANGIKLETRCGMGPCQGRMCEPILLRLMAQAGHPDDTGFTARFPARPVAIADLLDGTP